MDLERWRGLDWSEFEKRTSKNMVRRVVRWGVRTSSRLPWMVPVQKESVISLEKIV